VKIIVVGATGTIGRAIVDEFSPRHELVEVGNQKGDVNVDITSTSSITQMYETIGAFDALVSATGKGYFGDFASLTEVEMAIGIQSKLMGQINLVLIGRNYIRDHGSFPLPVAFLAKIRFLAVQPSAWSTPGLMDL
jgi:NAD(P)-dependent dehydrogenase (short-subunit alcohol dehydrogenase family)